MKHRLYTDVHVLLAITRALRHKGFDVLTAQEDGTTRLPDGQLLSRAGELGRLIFTQDEDFLAEAAGRLRQGIDFATVIYAHQYIAIGVCAEDLALVLSALDPGETRNQVLYLPL
ncbi:MAG TPA: DUF5615 family PIN-like protein [Verrucomicrobiales bacterium]|nr:DUF5615 family PIN-like protein [Verrucomicrobiales bacterium]